MKSETSSDVHRERKRARERWRNCNTCSRTGSNFTSWSGTSHLLYFLRVKIYRCKSPAKNMKGVWMIIRIICKEKAFFTTKRERRELWGKEIVNQINIFQVWEYYYSQFSCWHV